MRKIFTIAAALLTSLVMFADLSFNEPEALPEGYVYSSANTPSITTIDGKSCVYVSNGGGGQVVAACFTEEGFDASKGKRWMGFQIDADSKLVLNVYSNKKVFTLYNDKAEAQATFTNAAKAWEDWTIENLPAGKYILSAGSSQCYVSAMTFGEGVAPSTDPVSKVSIEGPTECFVGKTITLKATFDVKPDTIWWTDKFGGNLENNNKATLEFTPDAEGSYTFVVWAQNEYNSEPASSEIFTVGVTEKPAAVACSELYPAAEGDAPAAGGEVALKSESFGGQIFFAGAKNWAESFQYNEFGLQMCKGGADSVRVELGFKLQEGSEIELQINQNGLSNDKARGFKLLAPGKKTVMTATWQQESETDLARVFTYTVTNNDGLAGQNTFVIQRSESAILHAVVVSDCGEEIVPDTDPVSKVEISGPDAAYVGQTITLKATTDKKATSIEWQDAASQTLGFGASYVFNPDVAGEFTFFAIAKNEYNVEPVKSEAFVVTISEKPAELEQVSISADTEWDWNNAATVDEIKFTNESTPQKNERVLLANVDGMNNNSTFNSQALLFEGEYAMRIQSNMKLCQGQLLQFNTTVPGYVSIEYSNTGNREAAEGEEEGQEKLRRFLLINDELVANDPGSMKSSEKTVVLNIPVAAGDVAISGKLANDPSAAVPQYIRIFKVSFTTELLPEGISNTAASVKAVKVIRDGQLLILRDGVMYNAQGAMVK